MLRSLGSGRLRLLLVANELAYDIGANRPRRNLRGFRLLAFALRPLVGRADESPSTRTSQPHDLPSLAGTALSDATRFCSSTHHRRSSHERCVATENTVNFVRCLSPDVALGRNQQTRRELLNRLDILFYLSFCPGFFGARERARWRGVAGWRPLYGRGPCFLVRSRESGRRVGRSGEELPER